MTPENQKPFTAEEFLRKQNRRLRKIVLVLALIVLAVALVYIYNHWQNRAMNFIGRNDDTTSNPHLNNYRKRISLVDRSWGVYYDRDDIKKYVDSIWPLLLDEQLKYEQAHNIHIGPNFKWVVGFYWMMKKDANSTGRANKLSFYVIPTLARKDDPKVIIDYFKDDGTWYYHGDPSSTNLPHAFAPPPPPPTKTGPAYDEGQLFP